MFISTPVIKLASFSSFILSAHLLLSEQDLVPQTRADI